MWGQPINTATSLGYAVVGGALIARGFRRRRRARRADITYGTLLIAIGLGSAAFHGPQPRGSQALHDAPIAAALYFILIHNLVGIGRLQQGERPFIFGVVPVAALGSAPALAPVLSGGLALVAIASEVLVYRSGQTTRSGRRTIVALMAAAGAAYLFGRTGSPLCHPESPFQLHGAWHLLSAAALGGWGWVALQEGTSTDRTPGSPQ
jgi:hypothetical protein